MSGQSSVGQRSTYEADDQRPTESHQEEAKRGHQGKENSHKANDASMQPGLPSVRLLCFTDVTDNFKTTEDQRTLANRVAALEKVRERACQKNHGADIS
jgi:hypothetical protein